MGMVMLRTIRAQQACSERWRRRGLRLGFVPTMGALHAGHLSLVAAARRNVDRLVVSVFVNPIQFGPREDFHRYPRTLARDRALLSRAGVDVLFSPAPAAMYPPGFATRVTVEGPLVAGLCAPWRPGHFAGVTTVVARFFQVVRPHAAWFGQKDAQQVAIIRRMTQDLGTGVRILVGPIVRESDGLALSSRNRFLDRAGRMAAPALWRGLQAGRAAIRRGERSPAGVRAAMRRVLAPVSPVRVQYLDIVDAETLQPLSRLRGRVLLAIAAFVGRTRLIDNLPVRVPR